MGGQTYKHTGLGVRQSRWRRAGMLKRPPRHLQQQPMLRVYPESLPRGQPEKRRVEPRYVIDEACPAGHNLPGCVGIWVEKFLDIPPIRRDFRYRIAAFPEH